MQHNEITFYTKLRFGERKQFKRILHGFVSRHKHVSYCFEEVFGVPSSQFKVSVKGDPKEINMLLDTVTDFLGKYPNISKSAARRFERKSFFKLYDLKITHKRNVTITPKDESDDNDTNSLPNKIEK